MSTNYLDLENDIKNQNLHSIYVLYGDEEYLKQEYLKKIKKVFGELSLGINYILLDETNIDTLITNIETLSFGYEKKLIVVKNSNIFKKDTKSPMKDKFKQYILENMQIINDSCTIVFIEETVHKMDLYKTVEKNAVVLELKELKPSELKTRLKRICTMYKVQISDENLIYLIENAGTKMQTLINEVRKLIEFAGENGTIQKEDIDKLTIKEMQYIKSKLETTVNELEDLTKIATSTLSELTHYTTIAIGPKIENHTILDIKFVLLGSRVMMAIILTDSGIIREAIIKFDEDVTEEQIKKINYIFSNNMVGKPLDDIGGNIEEFITKEMQNNISIIKKIIEEINKIFKQNNDLFLEGANRSFDLPEFQQLDLVKNFMNVLDAKDLVSNVLNTGVAEDINVYIGDELQDEKLKDFSVVTFNHLLDDKDIGTIGIIGPKRMDYSKIISIMKYISKKLKEDYNNENKK